MSAAAQAAAQASSSAFGFGGRNVEEDEGMMGRVSRATPPSTTLGTRGRVAIAPC